MYFEIYGKKMVAEIDANSKEQAEYKLRGKIIVHKIEEIEEHSNPFEMFGDLLNSIKRK